MEQIAFLNQYSKPPIRSSQRSGVLAFLSCIYRFDRKGKRITDDGRVKFESLADRCFVEEILGTRPFIIIIRF
jgi:hypothetical protein